jgi:ABC-type polysaccharide/polyol phosphate export permease
MLRDLWQYRALVLGMVGRELRLRDLDSALGSAWPAPATIEPVSPA